MPRQTASILFSNIRRSLRVVGTIVGRHCRSRKRSRTLQRADREKLNELRVCAGITCAFWRERRAGRCEAPRRRRCGVIVEERQQSRCPPAAAPLTGCGPQARWLCCSLLTYYRYARRSRLASEPGGRQQNVNLIH